jgi:hypothetical protein
MAQVDPALTATGRADTEAINTAHATASVTNEEGDMTLIDDDNTFRCLKIRPASDQDSRAAARKHQSRRTGNKAGDNL